MRRAAAKTKLRNGEEEDEADQGGKEGTVGRNQEAKEESLTETRLGFRSDRAAKTNRALSAADSSPWLLLA
ncbi:hypothetical protein K0M31_016467 [Melipona bicolor]|uniref:Uncharacterized protein n=1 Tax=Melipona bicolor TaxID=60889 RepID=A0AA40KTM2_9HYME|nr:hypothetical protein K0M31_016467 [Melipona bicolor]